jgi:hypothetical protein
MNRQRDRWGTVLSGAAFALSLALGGCDSAAPVLPRETVVPLSAVTQQFPDVTKEAGTARNETSVGKPAGSISVIFTSADGKKKVTLSIDQYASVDDAAAAYKTAVDGSLAAPGFKPAATPSLGEEAFAGTSQVGEERHFGLGARDGALIVSATHAGDIPVTPENSEKLTRLAADTLAAAKQSLLGAD